MQQSTLKVGENMRLTQQLTIAHKRVHYNASMNKAYDHEKGNQQMQTSGSEVTSPRSQTHQLTRQQEERFREFQTRSRDFFYANITHSSVSICQQPRD
eukprot:scaffold1928_cov109-Alexandrium_tamarense.AAC.36